MNGKIIEQSKNYANAANAPARRAGREGHLEFGFGASLGFGAWDLELPPAGP